MGSYPSTSSTSHRSSRRSSSSSTTMTSGRRASMPSVGARRMARDRSRVALPDRDSAIHCRLTACPRVAVCVCRAGVSERLADGGGFPKVLPGTRVVAFDCAQDSGRKGEKVSQHPRSASWLAGELVEAMGLPWRRNPGARDIAIVRDFEKIRTSWWGRSPVPATRGRRHLAGQVIALRAPTVQSTAGWLQQPDAVDEKASYLSQAFNKPGWRNGKRGGLKIRCRESGLRVPAPPPAPGTV